ncbi:methyl-accepting chemotaxis protein [Rhodoligotrophos appendicifer]|uniref:methyl-accepting chemotaxis protein n=1 Tax=Rhodoligotrophos appendicifer TaxID=987056 RepID=UPI001FE6C68E|nr:methyl-accepting chemotaxis protein [Rhodoligotrophos appendicifer]
MIVGLSIGNRILLGFALIIAVLIGVSFYILAQFGTVRDATDLIVTRDFATMRQFDRALTEERTLGAAQEQSLAAFLFRQLGRVTPGEEPSAVWRRQAAVTEGVLSETLSSVEGYRDQAIAIERKEAWTRLTQSLKQASEQFQKLRTETERQFAAISANNLDEAIAAQDRIVAERVEFLRIFEDSRDVLTGVVVAGQNRSTEIYNTSRQSIVIALILTVILGIVVSYALRQSIVRPLTAFMDFAEQVGQGDLNARAHTGSNELGRLGGSLNEMVGGLRTLTLQGREATGNLNAAAEEIRASTQEQAASVAEQLAAVQETAATVDEITHAGAQIGKRAQEVIAGAQSTVQTSNAGLKAVDDATKAMDLIREQAEAVAENIVSLSEKTQAIGDIIATVNDISERSHLLALNAAIEAAAAGEAGRSFAVVAAEMKMLADQAKEATSQVRSILGDIQRGINFSVMLTEEAVKRVTAGKEQTDTAQQTIEEITGQMQENVQTFQQIVASTNQQQLGIEQVMGALQNIREASQQTAESTRQLDQAAENLTKLSQQLVGLTERYKV